VFEVDFGIVWN